MAASEEEGRFSDEQLEAIKKRRAELLERIRQIDPAMLRGLVLSTGAPSTSIISGEDFHNYWFKAPDGFTETWTKARPQLDESE